MRKIYLYLFFLLITANSFAQNYTILGSASSTGGCNCFRLTPDAENQAGAIFQNQTINLNNSFDFSFNVFLGCNGSNGADGIVFVLTSNPNGLGNPGEGMGYAGSNQPYSIAAEFDTWQNGSAGDPSFDHIGINSGGGYSHNLGGAVAAQTSQNLIDDCGWHMVRIVWDVNANTFTVYFDGAIRQQLIISNMVNTYFGGNPIVNWGWSGATGGGTNDQQVCVLNTSSWVTGVNYQSCSPTMQFQDISTSSLGSVQSWAWDFGDGTTSTLQNPSHTYAGNGTYNVSLTITDLSGCTNTYSHPVVIAAPITLTPAITNPLCNGGANGSIALTPAGGFGPAAGYGGYTYTWNNNNTKATLPGLTAGTYAVTVTDGVCTSTAQYNVSQPTALTATTSHTNAPCNGNGTATIAISGGTPPYTGVNWAGFPGYTVSLPAGTWIADFRDANSCSALLQYSETITALPCGITSSVSKTNVTCFGGNNGSATLTVTTANPPQNITWSNGGTGPTISNLTAGTYTYNYTDGLSSHAFSGTVVITQPASAIVASLATVNTSCAGDNDGQAIVSVTSGGVTPFNYTWSPASANNPVAANLSAGTVSVTVTDGTGCTATASGTITGPPALTLNITSVDDSCFQSQTGSAMANVSGGNAPYTYYWSNISSAQNNLSLGVGTYTVTVTDDKGCTITGSTTINQPTLFTHTLASTNINCFGDATGTITVNASGGIPGYSYTWSNGAPAVSNPTNLAAGQYNLTLSDGNNCLRYDSVVLTQPTSALTATTSHQDVKCNGGSDGTLTITVGGGTPPYSFLGNPLPAGTTTIPGRPAGTYAGTVTDANNCQVAVSETIAEPGPQSLTMANTNEPCFGATVATASADFVNATGNVTYNWNGGQTGANLSNLAAGTYTVTATDQNLCSLTGTTTVTEPAAVALPVTVTDAACFGANGSATANPAGGNNPYNFVWSGAGGTTGQTVAKPAGTYTVTATDASTCQQTASFTINEPTGMNIAETHTNLSCFGDADGDITLTVTGGSGPNYTYSWQPNVSTTNVATLLTAGTYDVTVTDQASCTATTSVTLTQPALPVTLSIQSINISCFGANDGSISITTSGGTSPYTYAWNPNISNTNSASGLSPATYDITITDFNGCSVNPNITLTEPSQPLNLTGTQTNLTCNQSNDGAASVIANGGTAPYSFAWSPSVSTGPAATGLAAGNYTIVVTDNNGCTADSTFIITEPAVLASSESHTNVLCFGDVTGTVTVTATGGTPGYTYSWNPAVSTNDIATGLAAGTYSITVSDTNACSVVQTAIVTEPALLTLANTPASVLCFGTATGAITANPQGGTPNYTFAATDGTNTLNSSTGQFANLIAGNYTVTVTDQNSCTASATA
ncbi:MAG TPA: PKD domain-containing protein, partial [Chitinophagales bacterium]|nr:PKD domain-containing protein [Chitinophagales bacterium]